jgi:hypothetical protein
VSLTLEDIESLLNDEDTVTARFVTHLNARADIVEGDSRAPVLSDEDVAFLEKKKLLD